MYLNQGILVGYLAYDPKQVGDGVVVLTLHIRDTRRHPETGRRITHRPRVTVFGREAEKALQYLKKGQMVGIFYKQETRPLVDASGVKRTVQSCVATRIIYGPMPEADEAVLPSAELTEALAEELVKGAEISE